jgi:hypothetical protein
MFCEIAGSRGKLSFITAGDSEFWQWCQIRAISTVLTGISAARCGEQAHGGRFRLRKIGNLRGVGGVMVQSILSHWATYLFLAWVMVIGVANLWPARKSER